MNGTVLGAAFVVMAAGSCGSSEPAESRAPAPVAVASGEPAPAPPTKAAATPPRGVGEWTIETLAPGPGGPFDYPRLAVRGDRVVVMLVTLGGGPSYLGEREAGRFVFVELAESTLMPDALQIDASGHVHAAARRIVLGPPGTDVLYGRPDGETIAFDTRATGCALAGSRSELLVSPDGPVLVYTCQGSVVIDRRQGAGWDTVVTLADLSLGEAALSADGTIHLTGHVLGTPESDYVAVRGGRAERHRIPERTTTPELAVAPDGTAYVLYDRLDRESFDRVLVLGAYRSGGFSEDVIGPGNDADLTVDARGRPVLISADMFGSVEPRVLVRRADGWQSIPFAEDQGDTVVGDAVVDERGLLHVVYAWTGDAGRVVRYAFVRLPD